MLQNHQVFFYNNKLFDYMEFFLALLSKEIIICCKFLIFSIRYLYKSFKFYSKRL